MPVLFEMDNPKEKYEKFMKRLHKHIKDRETDAQIELGGVDGDGSWVRGVAEGKAKGALAELKVLKDFLKKEGV